MSSDFTLPLAVDRLAVAGDRLVVQDAGSLFMFDVSSRSTHPLLAQREGADLVCAFAGGRVLILDTDGDLRVIDEDGQELARESLGEEAELGAVRVLPGQQRVVVLIPDMVGDDMLGVARFRFLITDEKLTMTWVDNDWPRWPDVWTVDSVQMRLLVQTAENSHEFLVFALDNGKAGAGVTLPASAGGLDTLTAIDFAPDGAGFMLGQWSATNGYARIGFLETGADRDKTLLCLDPAQGEVRRISCSPDGSALVFQYGAAERPLLGYLDLVRDADRPELKFLSVLEPDTDIVWIAPRQLVAITDENAITFLTLGGL